MNNNIIKTLNKFSIDIFNTANKLSDNELLITIGNINIITLISVIYLFSEKNTKKNFKTYFNNLDSNILFNLITEINKFISEEKNIEYINMLLLSNKYQIDDKLKKKINNLCLFDNIETLLPEKECDYYNNIVNTKFKSNKNHLNSTIIYKNDLIMTNIVNFKTNWKKSFRPENTSVKIFYSNNKKKLIPMMKLYDIEVKLYKKNSITFFELECHNNMNVGFYQSEVYSNLNWNNLYTLLKESNLVNINKLVIPKFKKHCKFKLDNILKDIGMEFIFKEIESNNYINNSLFKLSNTNHQILFELNEGNNNDIIEKKNSDLDFVNSINLNSPFTYYVRDIKRNIILLIGVFR